MANVRFKSFYYSHSNKKYELKILDTELVSSTNYDINWGDSKGAVINRNGGSPDDIKRIVSTNATITLAIENSNDQALYDDIKNSYEGRFFMEINWFHPITDAFTNIFKGSIKRDLSALSDGHEQIYQITATDGLEDLKRIDYTGDATPNAWRTVANHVGTILNQLPIATLYDSFQDFYQFAVDLRDENHAVGSIYARDTRVRNYFYELRDEIKEFQNSYDVLHEFLSSINARIYFHKGIFCIAQMGYKGAGSTVQYEVFHKDKSYDATVTSDSEQVFLDDDDLQADAFPLIKSIAPVQYVKVTQSGKYLGNTLYGKTWQDGETDTVLVTSITEIEENQRLLFSFNLDHYMLTTRPEILVGTWAKPVLWCRLRLEVKITDGGTDHYYAGLYKNVFYYYPEPINMTMVYGGTTQKYIEIIIPISKVPPETELGDLDPIHLAPVEVFLTSHTVQHTGIVSVGVLEFKIFTDSDLGTEVTLDPAFAPIGLSNEVLYWQVNKPLFMVGQSIPEGIEISNRTTKLTNDLRNNIVIDEEFTMGVFPNTISNQKIQIYNSAGFWIDSTGWRGTGDTTYQRLAVQVIRDIIKLRKTPSDLIEISLWDRDELYNGYDRIFDYKGRNCIWLDWTHNHSTDTIKGSLWEMINADVEDNPTPTTSEEPTIGLGLPPGIVTNIPPPPNYNSTGTQNFIDNPDQTEDFYHEATMTSDTIDLSSIWDNFPDPDTYTMVSINHSLKIYIGQELKHIVDKTKANLDDWECRLNYSTKSIEFKRNQNNRLIRIDSRNLYKIKAPSA